MRRVHVCRSCVRGISQTPLSLDDPDYVLKAAILYCHHNHKELNTRTGVNLCQDCLTQLKVIMNGLRKDERCCKRCNKKLKKAQKF